MALLDVDIGDLPGLVFDHSTSEQLLQRQEAAKLPVPFDSIVGNNFTEPSCTDFFRTFLSDPTFQACHALSLLLQTSASFFAATKSLVLTTQALDASCSANVTQCNNLMSGYAQQLVSDSTCGIDFGKRNAIVLQAYNGFVAYAPLYYTGCLRNAQNGNYCFASAVTNGTSPTSSYIYYLALGVPLPAGTMPSCNGCLQNTMSVFHNYASNATQPLSQTFSLATGLVNLDCGPMFVQPAVAAATTTAAAARSNAAPAYVAVAAAAAAAAWLAMEDLV